MAALANYVEIIKNNMEYVVLKVKTDSREGLVSLGCFTGNEELLRLTKGAVQTCTIFYRDGSSFSWNWGRHGYTVVPDSIEKCGSMIRSCLEEDFDICIAGSREDIEKTILIRRLGDSEGMVMAYKLMWFQENDICIYKNDCYLKHMDSLEDAKNYVYNRIEYIDQEHSVAWTGCQVLTITGLRKYTWDKET